VNSLLQGLGLFETLRVSGGVPEFLSHHIERMSGSARSLGLDFLEEGFLDALAEALADRSPDLDWRVRITLFLDEGPRYMAKAEPLGPIPEIVELALSDQRVFSGNPLCQHKTVSRLPYYLAQREAEAGGSWDGLLLNERDKIAETGRANVFFLLGDELLTPPLSSGVLPGIARRVLLERGLAMERVLCPGDVRRAGAGFVTNSLIRAAGVSRIRGLEYEPDPVALEAGLLEIRNALVPG
jgi:branched-subunit amino acid aminotransferase/4-amino-4-deoxychorismate lyase